MSDLERTSAELQMVIPGCERRTLPKSTSRVDWVVRAYFTSTSRRDSRGCTFAAEQRTKGIAEERLFSS